MAPYLPFLSLPPILMTWNPVSSHVVCEPFRCKSLYTSPSSPGCPRCPCGTRSPPSSAAGGLARHSGPCVPSRPSRPPTSWCRPFCGSKRSSMLDGVEDRGAPARRGRLLVGHLHHVLDAPELCHGAHVEEQHRQTRERTMGQRHVLPDALHPEHHPRRTEATNESLMVNSC